MKRYNQIQKAKREVIKTIQIVDNPEYYKGMLTALNWVLGRRELFNAEDEENVRVSISNIMNNVL